MCFFNFSLAFKNPTTIGKGNLLLNSSLFLPLCLFAAQTRIVHWGQNHRGNIWGIQTASAYCKHWRPLAVAVQTNRSFEWKGWENPAKWAVKEFDQMLKLKENCASEYHSRSPGSAILVLKSSKIGIFGACCKKGRFETYLPVGTFYRKVTLNFI